MKKINKSGQEKLLYQSDWLVENEVHYNKLTICPGARLLAPEGKFITLLVDGAPAVPVPGTYKGKLVFTVESI